VARTARHSGHHDRRADRLFPVIFAAPGPAPTNYLALVLHLVPPRPATPTPTLPPPSYNNCQADPNPSAAPNYPIRITTINKAAGP
jgi:hypothetical protein